jgi:hypothetical protein
MLRFLILLLALLAFPTFAYAEVVRFLFVPIDPCGATKQVAVGPDGSLGEKLTGFGFIPKPYTEQFRPTHMVTFRHPYTVRHVTVPLTLPTDTPRMEYRDDRIIYNYGSYTVEARFLPNGSVETIYNSGFLRPVAPQ